MRSVHYDCGPRVFYILLVQLVQKEYTNKNVLFVRGAVSGCADAKSNMVHYKAGIVFII